ncbi:hypothetical protein [Granulosicoccus sp. 3-233]|uniref:hypothetical protein n=1 Tax=Granulosicoccus sp. 3-233 TaxID=3417969 RepID=UPI003D328D80
MLLWLLPFLGACDGGIFGTGDGGDIINPDNVEGSDPTDGAGDGDGQTDAGDTPGPDDADNGGTAGGSETAPQARGFENLLAGSDRETPLLSLINLSQSPITAFADADTTALFTPAIQPGDVSSLVAVPLNSQSLSLIEADEGRPQLLLSPLNLGVSSVSTLIVRDRFDETDTDSDTSGAEPDSPAPLVEILALPSRLSPGSDALARVRILQAYAIAGDTRSAQMLLLPAGDDPGGSEVSLGSVSPADFQQIPDYREVTAGSYAVQDSLQRFSPVPVTLAASQSYTLILDGSDDVIMIVQDSESGDPR